MTCYEIFENQMAALTARVEKLNKKLSSIGVPTASLKTVKTVDVPRADDANIIDRVLTVEVIAPVPTTPSGWQFVARIVHTPDGNIVNHVPGTGEIPVGYREGKPCCDHCQVNRFRRDTYIVRRDAETKQVGSSCLEEFLGTKNAMTLAAAMDMVNDLHEAVDNASKAGRPLDRTVSRIPLMRYLGYVAELTIKEGTYVTRSQANAKGDRDLATSRRAYRLMFEMDYSVNPPVPRYPVSEAAATLAEDARQTVLNKFSPVMDIDNPSFDVKAAILSQFTAQAGLSDFEHNLFTIAKSESIEPRLCGVAAYVIEFHRRAKATAQRATATAAAPKLSAEGMPRIFAMFENAAKHLKHVAINLASDNAHLHLSLAGAKSKNAGCIYVKASAGFNSPYYGKITPEGRFLSVGGCPSTVEPLLLDFAKNPEEVAAKSGKLTGRCSFCNRKLTDDRSTDVGYGPVCADKFGLAWGHKHTADCEHKAEEAAISAAEANAANV